MDRIELWRRAGLCAVILPMMLGLIVPIDAVWFPVSIGVCILLGLAVALWCQMVQDHAPPHD